MKRHPRWRYRVSFELNLYPLARIFAICVLLLSAGAIMASAGNIILNNGALNVSGNALVGGNLGIGTASPQTPLDVRANTNVNLVSLNQSNPNDYSILSFYRAGSTIGGFNLQMESSAYGDKLSIARTDSPYTRYLTVDGSNGNVGIGTTSPGQKLDVNGAARVRGSVTFGSAGSVLDSTSVDNFILRTNANSPNPNFAIGVGNGSGGWAAKPFFWNNGYLLLSGNQANPWCPSCGSGTTTPDVVINPSGDVGIGTTTPGSKLTVAGTVESTSGGFKFPDGSVQSTAAGSGVWVASGSNLYSSNTGNVGIGTTSPAQKLDVNGASRAVTVMATDHFAATYGSYPRLQSDVANTPIYLGASNSASGNVMVVFKNDASIPSNYLMSVANSGNVGVGTASPSSKLTVNAASDTSGNTGTWGPDMLVVSRGGGTTSAGIGLGVNGASGFSWVEAATPGSSYNKLILNPAGGNVGIGTTSPGAKLEVNGNIKLSGASPTYRITNVADPSAASDVVTKGYADANYKDPPGQWTCTVRTGPTVTGTSTASCTGNEKVISGGCSAYANNIQVSSYPTNQGWNCYQGGFTVTAYANCCS